MVARTDRAGRSAFLGTLWDFVVSIAARSKPAITSLLILILIAGLLDALRLVLLVPIIDVINPTGADRRPQRWGHASEFLNDFSPIEKLIVLLGLFIAFTTIRSIVVYARDIRIARIQAEFVSGQRLDIMQLLGRSPWHSLNRIDHARVSTIIGVECQRLGTSIDTLMQMATSIVTLFVQGVIAILLAPQLALASFVILSLGATVTILTQRGTAELGRRFTVANQAVTASSSHFLGALKSIVAQNAQNGFLTEFGEAQSAAKNRQIDFAMARARRALFNTMGLATAGALVVLAGFGAFGVRLAILLTLIFLFARMAAPMARVQWAIQNLAFSLPGFRSISTLREELFSTELKSDEHEPPPPEGSIALTAATYMYPGGGGVQKIELNIAPGEMVGIIGPSGHGKTTLVDLLAGLLQLQEGTLKVGDVILDREEQRRAWRRQIGYVTQDSLLFHGTVRDNLSWGNNELNDCAAIGMLEWVGGSPLLKNLGSLNAIVGERGSLISGGERQRIGIARTLLRHPRLLLLDEATNALDAASEVDLLNRLADMPDRPAIVIVSHRPDSLARCDRIFTVRDGQIAAQ